MHPSSQYHNDQHCRVKLGGCHGDQQVVVMEISRWLLWRSAAWFPSNHVFSEHERQLQALE